MECSTYDDDAVVEFMEKFDGLNVRRIERGLGLATKQLRGLPAGSRRAAILDPPGLYALFESLTCRAMYSNDSRLKEHFDEPFGLVQTNRFLKMSSYAPAMTQFLFGANQARRAWAEKSWEKFKRNITDSEFEWSVKEPLIHAMARIQMHNLQKAFLKQFWDGVYTIVHRLDRNQITHSLRALRHPQLNTDVCSLAFNHLQIDDDAFMPLLGTIGHILRTAPPDLLEAMGTLPPNAWIEQFFNSPALARLLETANSETFENLFGWITPFMNSINIVKQPAVARAFVDQLLGPLQDEIKHSRDVRNHCLNLGLTILSETFRNLSNETSSTGATAEELFELIEKHSACIAPLARRKSTLVGPASEVLRQALGYDCNSLRSHMKLLTVNMISPDQTSTVHTSAWRTATSCLDVGNIVLTQKVILALRGLAGLEPFVAKNQPVTAPREKFNKSLASTTAAVKGILERITDFEPADLEQLFGDTDSINATISLLFSSDADVRTGAAELLKTLTQQTTRREAVDYILRKFFTRTLEAFSYCFSQITYQKAFVPAQSTIKLCADMLDVLCNSEDGVLRSQSLTVDDARAVERLWKSLWDLLTMIFQTTEAWSSAGHDKDVLMNFCRDVMEFAEKSFDQFGVIKGALDPAVPDDSDSATSASRRRHSSGQELINQPRNAMKVIVQWLKLRDEFLVARSSSLVGKLLVRLKDFDTMLDDGPLGSIFEIVTGDSRSTLSQQQKAELRRALETHVGESLEVDAKPEIVVPKVVKKEVIDLDKWTMNAKTAKAPDITLDAAIAASSSAYERFKAQKAAKDLAKPVQKPYVKPAVASAPKPLDTSEFIRRRKAAEEEKKTRDAAAIAARRARALGEGSGMQAIGIKGKSDAPKGTGMMVSSGEESSEEESESELDRELFGPATKTKSTGLTDAQKKAMKQRQSGPVKKTRIVRSAKDMRARLAPDLAALHKTLLSWDYFHDGAFPPGQGPRDYASVLNTFRDASEYQRTFQGLLTLETWSNFTKAKEENTAQPFEVKILNRSNVDAFVEVSTSMPMPKVGGRDSRLEVGDGDIVLLSQSSAPAADASIPHCLAKVTKITRKKGNAEVLYRIMPGNSIVKSLAPGVVISALNVMSITPLEREYGALLGLQYYDLCDEITRAKPSPLLNYSDQKLLPLEKTYNVNKAQAKAIQSAIDNDAFTLVQGPPGSGKTKTIVAIVGALLTSTLRIKGMITKPDANGQGGTLDKKMLICAPSNAAVDELVMRFREGVKTLTGEHSKINVVRLGRTDAMNENVKEVALEELVNKKLNLKSVQSAGVTRADTQKIFDEHQQVSIQLRELRAQMDEADAGEGPTEQLKENFDNLRRKKTMLGQKIDSAKDNEQNQSRQADIQRRKAMQEVISDAHIICATLSGSGHDMFRTLNVEFETVIIDEAAQCVELSALIPLKYGCAKCILVGDPQQLPPTVFSRDAARFKYEQSLFVRMQTNHSKDVHLLDTQYRMHPEISVFPSKMFYEGRLLDGAGMAGIRSRPWHGTSLLSPYRFFDVQGQHSAAPTGHSLVNHAEVRVALQLYHRLTVDFPRYDFKGKIGIITPYKSQLRELKMQFQRQLGEDVASEIEFNTTDAFQGREAEIIIFSCVRASPGSGIGFLNDIRRMNVGLTRAKCSLWVLGNSQSLMKGEFWAKLVEESKARDRYTTGALENMLRTPTHIVQKVEDGTANDPTSKQSAGGPASIDVKMSGISDDEEGEIKDYKFEDANIKQEKKPLPQPTKSIKQEAKIPTGPAKVIKPEPRRPHALIPSIPKPVSKSTVAPIVAPGSLKRKLSTADDSRNTKELASSRSASVQSQRDSDSDMKDASDRGSSARPSSRNSDGLSKVNGTAKSGRPLPATNVIGGGHASASDVNGKAPPPRPPAVTRKKADPFIRKKR